MPSPQAPGPNPQAPEKGPLALDRLRSLWPAIVARARAGSPLFGTLVAGAEVVGVERGVVTLRVLDQGAGHAEGLEHKRDPLAKLIGEWVTEPVRVKLEGPGTGDRGPGGGTGAQPRPARLTEESANAERLKVLRTKDPTLNAAVDALDLELLE